MSIFESYESRFCKRLFHYIVETKPELVARVLHDNELFYQETAILLSLYSFGYCMGSLDIELSKRYSPSVCDRISDRLHDLFLHYLNKNVIQPGIPPSQRTELMSSVLLKSNNYRSYVYHVLTNEPKHDIVSLISSSFRDMLCVGYFDLDEESQPDFDYAVMQMIDFSSLPFRWPNP